MKKNFSLVICTMTLLFSSCENNAPGMKNGIGVFSVSESKQVTFSPGNLQYHPANNKWRFAESQLDYIGDANENISDTYDGWLDLFGWSTSATNFGVSISRDEDDYYGEFVDWGINRIGGFAPTTWRTLTEDEWDYLLYERNYASALKGVAQVNGVNGLILLPDDWTYPSDLSFKSGFHRDMTLSGYGQHQTFTIDQWSKFEREGAVFLPAAGRRTDSSVYDMQDMGYYWASTAGNWGDCIFIQSNDAYVTSNARFRAQSVRLVKDL